MLGGAPGLWGLKYDTARIFNAAAFLTQGFWRTPYTILSKAVACFTLSFWVMVHHHEHCHFDLFSQVGRQVNLALYYIYTITGMLQFGELTGRWDQIQRWPKAFSTDQDCFCMASRV